MALSINSTMKDLLADAGAKTILENAGGDTGHAGWTDDPQLQPAMGMSLKEMAGYSQGQLTEEMLAKVDEALGKL